jgi:hypothetical protein
MQPSAYPTLPPYFIVTIFRAFLYVENHSNIEMLVRVSVGANLKRSGKAEGTNQASRAGVVG